MFLGFVAFVLAISVKENGGTGPRMAVIKLHTICMMFCSVGILCESRL